MQEMIEAHCRRMMLLQVTSRQSNLNILVFSFMYSLKVNTCFEPYSYSRRFQTAESALRNTGYLPIHAE